MKTMISEVFQMKKKIVMFTGDSITDCNRARPVGDGFGKMGDSYVARIFVDTWADFPENNIQYMNSATSGNTTKQLLDRFDEEVLAYNPDYVCIMIGVNDVWRHFDGSKFTVDLLYPEDTANNMETMIKKVLATGAKPIILSPYFLDRNHEDPMRRMVDEINVRYKALAEKNNIGYIDIQTKFDEYLKTGSGYILSADRVHPKAPGISLIARCVYNHPDFRVIFHD